MAANQFLERDLITDLGQRRNVELIPELDIDALTAVNALDATNLLIHYFKQSLGTNPEDFNTDPYQPDSKALQQLANAENDIRPTAVDSATRAVVASDVNNNVLKLFEGSPDSQTTERLDRLAGATGRLSATEHAPVDWTAAVTTVGLVIGLLYLLLSFGALIAARWHERTLEFLSDPLLSKVVGWPHLFLRFSKPLQIWVLEPWFAAVQRRESGEPNLTFFPIPACAGDGGRLVATDLIQQLRAGGRLWLQGNSWNG